MKKIFFIVIHLYLFHSIVGSDQEIINGIYFIMPHRTGHWVANIAMNVFKLCEFGPIKLKCKKYFQFKVDSKFPMFVNVNYVFCLFGSKLSTFCCLPHLFGSDIFLLLNLLTYLVLLVSTQSLTNWQFSF